jgi:nucleoside-specific outer membrane channel protein Tsx
MKKILLSLLALGTLIATSAPIMAEDDRADHNWNDEYWHHNHDGYWHGHKGHWEYKHHKHTFIEAGPVTIETH